MKVKVYKVMSRVYRKNVAILLCYMYNKAKDQKGKKSIYNRLGTDGDLEYLEDKNLFRMACFVSPLKMANDLNMSIKTIVSIMRDLEENSIIGISEKFTILWTFDTIAKIDKDWLDVVNTKGWDEWVENSGYFFVETSPYEDIEDSGESYMYDYLHSEADRIDSDELKISNSIIGKDLNLKPREVSKNLNMLQMKNKIELTSKSRHRSIIVK